MKKTRQNLMAAALCVAGLSTCLLSTANAESSASILLDSATGAGLPPQSFASPLAGPTVNLAFKGNNFQYNNPNPIGLGNLAKPTYSPITIGGDPVNTIIPEPTSSACILLGLGVLAAFRYLKVGRRI
jgi:hypothetical protein